MRVVLDTNVFISGLLFLDGPPGKVLRLMGTPGVVLLVSRPILDELERKLREKFGYDPADAEEVVRVVREGAEFVETVSHVDVVRNDPSDNRILECAVDGGADLVVSGDRKHLLRLRTFNGIPMLSPIDFLRLFPG